MITYLYIKGSESKPFDEIEWHIADADSLDGNGTYATLCGYPKMLELPRHTGRLQPSAMINRPAESSLVCVNCSNRKEGQMKKGEGHWHNEDGALLFLWKCICGASNQDDFGEVIPAQIPATTLPCAECGATQALPELPAETRAQFEVIK